MMADSKEFQTMRVEDAELPLAVLFVHCPLFNIKMITPAGQFEATVAPGRGFLGQRGKRKVSPLAREERDRS
jgi:hypothetical protein